LVRLLNLGRHVWNQRYSVGRVVVLGA